MDHAGIHCIILAGCALAKTPDFLSRKPARPVATVLRTGQLKNGSRGEEVKDGPSVSLTSGGHKKRSR
jgi:hypothetical protein